MKLTLETNFRFRNPFRRRKPPVDNSRMFNAAQYNRLIDWPVSYQRINGDLFMEYQTIVLRCRSLAQNNEAAIGLLKNFTRNVVGANGFILQSKALPAELRPRIEALWREYGSRSAAAVTMDERSSARDLDTLILRSLLIDGECFIHRVFDPLSRFGWRYEVIDSLQIDPFYMVEETEYGGRIFMGIEYDDRGREIAFWYRPTVCEQYQTGPRERIPASDIIHLFRREFPAQMRGIPAFAGAVLNLKQLDDYRNAELVHAQIGSCVMGVWEWDGQNGNDIITDAMADDKGQFIREIKPGIFPIAPRGYKAKFLQNPGTNTQFPQFVKSILRSITNCLGVSYNKGAGDYESVNYSSLREANLDDRESFTELQTVLIEGWKDLQFRDFIEYAFARNLVPGKTLAALLPHKFYGKRFAWVDPAKEIKAKREEMALMLTSPKAELEARGLDPDEVIADFKEWKSELEAAGLGGFWDAAFGMKEPEIAEQISEENENNAQTGVSND